jgi:hypothetical protein
MRDGVSYIAERLRVAVGYCAFVFATAPVLMSARVRTVPIPDALEVRVRNHVVALTFRAVKRRGRPRRLRLRRADGAARHPRLDGRPAQVVM